jgi:hypothetical protein
LPPRSVWVRSFVFRTPITDGVGPPRWRTPINIGGHDGDFSRPRRACHRREQGIRSCHRGGPACSGRQVTVLARARSGFHEVKRRGGDAIEGDATDAALMDGLVADIQPSVLILNAGATTHMGAIDEQNFDRFSVAWIPTSKLLFTASRRH